jgi:hypothetical protein
MPPVYFTASVRAQLPTEMTNALRAAANVSDELGRSACVNSYGEHVRKFIVADFRAQCADVLPAMLNTVGVYMHNALKNNEV